jgi:CHASE2 domain-containing sensor protein
MMAALIVGGLLLILAASDAVDRLERRTVDARFALRGDQPRDPRVAIVAMDGPTVRHLGRRGGLPLRRRDHARMIDILRRAGAREIVYDIEFDEAHFETPAQVREDEGLVNAIDRAGKRLVLASFVFNSDGQGILLGAPPPDDVTMGYDGVLQDPDGRLRKIEYAVHGPGGAGAPFRTMPAAAVEAVQGGPKRFSDPAWIDYRGREGSFETLSYEQVLARPALARRLRGKIVVVGATVDPDRHRTPAGGGSEMSGPEVQANAISTLLRGRPLRDTGTAIAVVIMVLLGAATIALVWRLPRLAAVTVPVLALAYFALAALLFDQGRVVPVVRPVLVIVLATAATLVLRLSMRRRRRARRAPATRPPERRAPTVRPGVPAGV